MKLLINEAATWMLQLTPDSTRGIHTWHYFVNKWCAVASRFGFLHTVTYTPDGAAVVVVAQECTLDDASMNRLFSGFLFNMFHPGIEWSEIEGEGCEFAMKVTLTPRTF